MGIETRFRLECQVVNKLENEKDTNSEIFGQLEDRIKKLEDENKENKECINKLNKEVKVFLEKVDNLELKSRNDEKNINKMEDKLNEYKKKFLKLDKQSECSKEILSLQKGLRQYQEKIGILEKDTKKIKILQNES